MSIDDVYYEKRIRVLKREENEISNLVGDLNLKLVESGIRYDDYQVIEKQIIQLGESIAEAFKNKLDWVLESKDRVGNI